MGILQSEVPPGGRAEVCRGGVLIRRASGAVDHTDNGGLVQLLRALEEVEGGLVSEVVIEDLPRELCRIKEVPPSLDRRIRCSLGGRKESCMLCWICIGGELVSGCCCCCLRYCCCLLSETTVLAVDAHTGISDAGLDVPPGQGRRVVGKRCAVSSDDGCDLCHRCRDVEDGEREGMDPGSARDCWGWCSEGEADWAVV